MKKFDESTEDMEKFASGGDVRRSNPRRVRFILTYTAADVVRDYIIEFGSCTRQELVRNTQLTDREAESTIQYLKNKQEEIERVDGEYVFV